MSDELKMAVESVAWMAGPMGAAALAWVLCAIAWTIEDRANQRREREQVGKWISRRGGR